MGTAVPIIAVADQHGRSCTHHRCCGSTVKVGYVVFFHWCTVLDEFLQKCEDAIQVTMDCGLYPEGQRCAELDIFPGEFEATKYALRTAVVI